MHLLVVLMACHAAPPPALIELEEGTFEINKREILLPLYVHPERGKQIERIRCYVSGDRATWKRFADVTTDTTKVKFTAPRDGLFWFAHQTISKDGKVAPSKITDLRPGIKLYVNSEMRLVKHWSKSYEELELENKELRQSVESLQRQVRELEERLKNK